MEAVAIQLFDGAIRGLIYVAIALSLTIVFGMLRLVNFAHGAFYSVGAYVGLILAVRIGYFPSIIVALFALGLVALILDRLVLRLFYGKDPTQQILVTFGIALVIQEGLRLIFGGTTQTTTIPPALMHSVGLGFIAYPAIRLVVAGSIILLVGIVWWFLTGTNYGLIVRAGIRDRTMVALLGGDVDLASRIVLIVGAGIAGVAGALASPIFGVDPNTGFSFLVPSFVVVVIGGLGSFWGAVIGGILVGELQGLTTLVFPSASDVVIYVAMAVILLLRPQGLLGESELIARAS
ncbi:MAG: branched-chain amino acid ABC transporter permease [Candidatus Eremiobacteraeota bacterium]|nr:branched-chain amino acid ABC transporter permease [Candidatus Eremiobacteraeota bacterium]MBV8353770.1 branched-chain amino acid ABC transporter permease [Candidatus Eremiobacteraeota bacterium]